MLAKLEIPGAWMWSAWQPDRGMNFNSYLFERAESTVAIDPLALDDASLDLVASMGGVKTIVLTNRDHERAAASIRQRFGSRILAHEPEAPLFSIPIDGTFADGDEVFPGAFAVAIAHGKTQGEIALHVREARTAIVGDALIGAPAGSVSLLPDEKLRDPAVMLLGLRRLWALGLQTLLLCDGQPVFHDADRVLGTLLETRGGAEINRINASDVAFVPDKDHGDYAAYDGEVGLLIGARKLGYRLARLDPGKAFCPLHWHVQCEEFFYVIEGSPSIRTSRGTIACRAGDFIAFPAGERGAHQLRNDSSEPCLVLLVGMEEPAVGLEACFYPDSSKIGVWTPAEQLAMIRSAPQLDYFDGE